MKWLALLLLLALPARSEPPTVFVFARHTFRASSEVIGPQPFRIGPVQFDMPLLGYHYEATQRGLQLARDVGAPALNEGARLAVEALGQRFDGRWDEIRCDLASSRDFFTGLYFREGLKQPGIVLSGCPTAEGHPVDAVTVGAPVKACQPRPGPVQLERVREAGKALLELVGEAPLEGTSQEYKLLEQLAMTVEMAAGQGPPLAQLLSGRERWEALAVPRASGYLGIRFTSLIPMDLACACAVFPLRYLGSLPAGRHLIACTHDDDISCLVRALGLLHDDDSAEQLAMFPLESWVFALDERRVAVVRLHLKLAEDGSFRDAFDSRLVWQGTRAEWQARLDEVERRAASWAPGREARAALRILPAVPLNVRYQP